MMKKISFFAIIFALFLFQKTQAQQTNIPNNMFGINWQLADSIGSGTYLGTGGKIYNLITKINASQLNLIRIGGNDYDQRGATFQQFAKACDSIINQLGATPLVEIPIYRKYGTTGTFNFTPTDAFLLLDFLINTKGFNIQYISLGNEPDLYPNNSDAGIDSISSKFFRYIPLIKQNFPNIKVVGPSLADYYSRDSTATYAPAYPRIIKALMGGYTGMYTSVNITGVIPSMPTKYYIDILDFHDYAGLNNSGLNAGNFDARRDSLINYSKNKFQNTIITEMYGTGGFVANANLSRTSNPITFALTEMNANYYNPPYSGTADDNNRLKNSIYGIGCNSFLAGQHWASMYMEGMKSGVCSFIVPWSIHESGGGKGPTDFGYLDGAYPTVTERSTYYHQQMLTENFNTKFCTGKVTSGQNYIRVMGSLNSSNELAIMILNMDTTNNFKFALRLDSTGTAFVSSNPLKMKVDGGINKEYTDSIENQSTMLLTFDLSGNLKKRCIYEMRGNLDINSPPTCTICGSSEVYIRDYTNDIGDEPNLQTSATPAMFWLSTDIWNRRDTVSTNELIHQNPEYRIACSGNPGVGNTNFIKVRLNNIGCQDVTGTLMVYWAKAATGLQWPQNFHPADCGIFNGACTGMGLNCGDSLAAQNVTIAEGTDTIVTFPWCPPDPTTYSCFGAESGHFCFIAHFDAAADPLGTLSNDVSTNSYLNNNVAWKNMTIIDSVIGNIANPHPTGAVFIRNIKKGSSFINMQFLSQKDDNNQTVLKYSRIRLYMSPMLMKRWAEGGKRGEGLVIVNDSVVEITDPKATMEHIFLKYGEIEVLKVEVTPFKKQISSADQYFKFDMVQINEKNTIDGGEQYLIQKSLNKPKDCLTATHVLSGNLSGIQTFTGDTILITGNVVVLPGAILTFNKMIVLISQNVGIKVMPGGKLNINHSEVIRACYEKKWATIEVKGNAIFANQLSITNSFIAGSDFPLTIDKSNGVLISGSTFLGDDIGIAVVMNKMKDFEISGNTFSHFETGIKTTKTDAASVKSLIVRNIFLNVKTALDFSQDNHTKLDIKCNRFSYTDYAILSDHTLLKDQGVIGEGAGNEFISNSTLANNKLKHTSGNSPKYYYNPSQPITSGMNITTLASMTDRTCYTYSFDTSYVARIMAPLNIQNEVVKQIMNVYAVPNPNSGEATIYFNLGEEKEGELVVMDMFGKIIERHKISAEMSKIEVNYNSLQNGMYLLSLTNSKGERKTNRMVITK